jgi:predicted esterase
VGFAALLAAALVGADARPAANSVEGVRVVPAEDGRIGTWLVVGPFRSATFDDRKKPATPEALNRPPPGVDETHLGPRAGSAVGASATTASSPPVWTIAASNEGAIDLQSLFHASDPDLIAYAAGTLHVDRAGRYYVLVGADDGVRVFVDGRPVFLRDEARPEREDDDMIRLDLPAGDHSILVKLHQREGGWRFGMRIVDESLRAPAGAWVTLPGASDSDARDLAVKTSWVSLDRGLGGDGYRPKLTVKFLEGAPRDVPLPVHVTLTRAATTDPPSLAVDAGQIAVALNGADEYQAALPPFVGDDASKLEDGDYTYLVDVAGRKLSLPFFARRATRDAVAHADRALAATDPSLPWIQEGSLESVLNLRDRLVRLVDHGDNDMDAQKLETRELDDAASSLESGADPYEHRTGPIRRAYRSSVDDGIHEFGLYVPPGYTPGAKRRWPLVVALHGLNGRPMAMLRWFFGGDVKGKDQDWEDRHWTVVDPKATPPRSPPPVAPDPTTLTPSAGPGPTDPLPSLDAFVVTPGGHGNAMYRDLGEDDVLRVLDWARRTYPIDPDRITITGPSMGGIGTAAIAFRHPDLFAAAAPLCGYHSYFVRRDILWHPIRPWERLLAEERSNVAWAENGENLPLWIVHGTMDLPEANSGVLIDRYEQLGYSVKHDHPPLGHNVWQTTYEGMKAANWLTSHTRVAHPRHLHFRTVRLRDGDDAWLHVVELGAPDAWGEVEASALSRGSVTLTTKGVGTVQLDRDQALFDKTAPLAVAIDGSRLTFAPDEAIVLHREAKVWKKGPSPHDGVYKHGEITGPLRDAFHAPLLFVYGADDPTQARANEEVARAWAQVRGGTTVKYPILSDAEFFARGEPLANDRALFLVGNAKSNQVVRALEGELPITIDGDAVVVGPKRITGSQVGAAFVRPNPRRPDRYLVVIEGVDALGTWRSLSLPDLVPDFVVWDDQVAPSRGQMLLGAGVARAAGFFENDWSLPAMTDDPLALRPRPGAKSEYDATSYLP